MDQDVVERKGRWIGTVSGMQVFSLAPVDLQQVIDPRVECCTSFPGMVGCLIIFLNNVMPSAYLKISGKDSVRFYVNCGVSRSCGAAVTDRLVAHV